MRDLNTITGILRSKRMKNGTGHNGNPRFRCYIGCYRAVTQIDDALNYDIQNWEGKEVIAVVGMHYGRNTVHTMEVVE